MIENWLPIKGYEGLYSVSDMGRVRRDGGRILKPWVTSRNKRHNVSLCKGGVEVTHSVHRLVLTAFVGECPDGMECCHNDGNCTNNVLSNLRWDTRKNNHADKHLHGTALIGEKAYMRVLSLHQVRGIRDAIASGRTQRSIAREYGVSAQTICNIANKRNWQHCQ